MSEQVDAQARPHGNRLRPPLPVGFPADGEGVTEVASIETPPPLW